MAEDRIAIVSDVHGNLTAYRAVLDALEQRGIEHVINLGDVIGKGPRGSACVALTRERCRVTVRGNWDAGFVNADDDQLNAAQRWWRDELTLSDRDWLASLPGTHDLLVAGRRVRLFHASAIDEFTRVMFRHTDEQFEMMFSATPFTGDGPQPTVVGYGDIHDAYQEVRGGRTLFNAGSVGNPLDDPTASYVVLHGDVGSPDPGPFSIEFVRLPYDIEAEIAVATACGMPALAEYARELRTGVYRGLVPLNDVPAPAAGDAATAPRPAPQSAPSVRR